MQPAPSLRILVVDDNRTMVKIITNLLSEAGYSTIDQALSGVEALEKLSRSSYDLVFSDWHMQPVDGMDLVRMIREDPRLKATKFIMVTAQSRTDQVIAARQAGVDSYIIKPFTAETLQAKIRAVFVQAA